MATEQRAELRAARAVLPLERSAATFADNDREIERCERMQKLAPSRAARQRSRSATNCVSTAIALSRRGGILDAHAEAEGKTCKETQKPWSRAATCGLDAVAASASEDRAAE